MALQKVAGSKLFIGSRVSYKTHIGLTDFAGQSWLQIKGWQQAGDLGAEDAAITQTLIDQNVTLYAKGPISFPILTNTFVPDYADPGQTAFRAAQQSCKPFAFRIQWGADCGEEAEVTISVASPAVIGWVDHGLVAGTPIEFSTTGTLPAGLAPGVTYYVVSVSSESFSVAATPGGSAIDTTDAGSGTHTAHAQPVGETDLLFGLAMRGTKTGGDAAASRLLNFPVQPIAEFITV